MNEIINSSYSELKKNGINFIYSIDEVSWWLLKYGDLYKSVVNSQNLLCDNCLKLKEENLSIDCFLKPNYCNKKDDYQAFIKFYNELDIVTELHKLEGLCKIAFNEYLTLSSINDDLRDWVIKHYDIYYKIGGHFFVFQK